MQKSSFGLASIKTEGRHLWPSDYLTMNGCLPAASMYDPDEVLMIKKAGFWTSDWVILH